MIRDFEQWSPDVDLAAYIDPQATIIGQVTLAADVSVWPQVVLRGDVNSISIGQRSNIQDGSILHVTHASEYFPDGAKLEVGDDVTVGHNVILHGCTVESECLIGMGSTVMDGAVVKAGSMIGAGALVTPNTQLESGYLWLGSPAKKVRLLSEKEREYIHYSAKHYVRLAEKHFLSP